MCKSSQVKKSMESSVNFKMFSRATLKIQIQDLGAHVGEKFIHWTEQLRIACKTRREQDLRETQATDEQNKSQDL